jgi:protease YdgD
MVGKLSCCLLAAAFNIGVSAAAVADTGEASLHREAVDVSAYPWSAIGKLFNEAGGACTGVIIARDKILTAAHCTTNQRTGRFLPPSSLHFMVGYRSGRSTAHARVAWYETGSGYDPLRWPETLDSDWVILTLTENLPEEIAPLKLRQEPAPSGTKAIIAGYPQDRAHLMTADRNCELGGSDGAGKLFHTCRGVRGYSGAPILVSMPGNEIQIAGIHVAMTQGDGPPKMIAVPAQSISREEQAIVREDEAEDLPLVLEEVAPAPAEVTPAPAEVAPAPTRVAWALSDRFDAGWPEWDGLVP